GATPIGRRITEAGLVEGGSEDVEIEVIGVVPDLITDVNVAESLAMYYPLSQGPDALFATLVVRASADPRAARRDAAATIKALDSRLAPGEMLRLDEEIRRQMNPQRFSIYVLGALGGVALLLTVLGTYVVAESMAVRRRREM